MLDISRETKRIYKKDNFIFVKDEVNKYYTVNLNNIESLYYTKNEAKIVLIIYYISGRSETYNNEIAFFIFDLINA